MYTRHVYSRWLRGVPLGGIVGWLVLFLLPPWNNYPDDSLMDAIKKLLLSDGEMPYLVLCLGGMAVALGVSVLLSASKMTITEQGVHARVQFKTGRIDWKDMKHIGAYYLPGGERMVCFSASPHSMYLAAHSHKAPLNKMLRVSYSKDLIEVIRRYWDKPIWGVDELRQPDES